ncbi:MAG TPA: hypothetical protein VJO14_03035 [Bacteroidota bacterium]|nr:hypothetical protein [Bacteroidota bacterium]
MNLRKSILSGGILLAYAVLVSRAPLLNYLGYEYSAAIALIIPFVPGVFFLRALGGSRAPRESGRAAGILRKSTAGRTHGTRVIPAADREVFTLAVWGLLIPLVVGWLNSFFIKNCAPGQGLAWFALLPGAGMIWVAALAYFCVSVFRRRVVWYFLIVALVLLHPLLPGYLTPRIDSYNFIYGYFPGFTYDEDLIITRTLILWRAVTLVCAVCLIAAGKIIAGRRERKLSPAADPPGGVPGLQIPVFGLPIRSAVFFLSFIALAAAWFFRTDLGFETTASSLRKTLGSFAGTRHFRIYYDSTAIPADEIRWVAAEHEFRFDQVSRFLGTDTARVIESYIYPGASARRRLIGAGNTDIAKPWRNEIHLDMDSWRYTLKHELVHALASEFGMPVIRANVNIGLVEGLAMAASPSFGNHTLREYAASMIHFGIMSDPGTLIRPAGFAFQPSTVSYVLMGAFCDHLIGTYGIGPFKTWYGGGSPVEAYGIGADSLVALWRASLDSVRVPDSWRAHTEYYFKRGSIFSRECARAVANLNAEGSAALSKNDHASARALFGTALAVSWNAGSFAGMARSLLGSGDFGGVVRMFEADSRDSLKSGSLAGYRMLLGDALLARGDYDAAGRIYADIHTLDLSPGMNEAVTLRLAVVETPDLREYLAPYIAGAMDDSAALVHVSKLASMDNPALLAFVRGKLLLIRKDNVSAARETANYIAPFRYPELNGAMSDLAGAAFFRLPDFLSARVFFEKTLQYGPGAVLTARVRDRVARCDWFGRKWGRMELRLR